MKNEKSFFYVPLFFFLPFAPSYGTATPPVSFPADSTLSYDFKASGFSSSLALTIKPKITLDNPDNFFLCVWVVNPDTHYYEKKGGAFLHTVLEKTILCDPLSYLPTTHTRYRFQLYHYNHATKQYTSVNTRDYITIVMTKKAKITSYAPFNLRTIRTLGEKIKILTVLAGTTAATVIFYKFFNHYKSIIARDDSLSTAQDRIPEALESETQKIAAFLERQQAAPAQEIDGDDSDSENSEDRLDLTKSLKEIYSEVADLLLERDSLKQKLQAAEEEIERLKKFDEYPPDCRELVKKINDNITSSNEQARADNNKIIDLTIELNRLKSELKNAQSHRDSLQEQLQEARAKMSLVEQALTDYKKLNTELGEAVITLNLKQQSREEEHERDLRWQQTAFNMKSDEVETLKGRIQFEQNLREEALELQANGFNALLNCYNTESNRLEQKYDAPIENNTHRPQITGGKL